MTASHSLLNNSAFSIHIAGDMEYTGEKYGDRGYRFLNLQAGHAAQNLYLVCNAFDLGVVASGGFLDDDFFQYIKSKKTIFLLYELFVGVIE